MISEEQVLKQRQHLIDQFGLEMEKQHEEALIEETEDDKRIAEEIKVKYLKDSVKGWYKSEMGFEMTEEILNQYLREFEIAERGFTIFKFCNRLKAEVLNPSHKDNQSKPLETSAHELTHHDTSDILK